MPAVKNKKKKVKKEVVDEEEQGEGEGVTVTTTCSLNENVFYHPVFLFCFLLFCSVLVALDVEREEVINRSHSNSRDPLTPEPQDLAPQKKKKKKKAPTVAVTYFSLDKWMDLVLTCDKTLFPMSPGRKAKAAEHSSNDLGAEDDDIVTDSQSPIPQHSLFSAPHGHSHPAGKVFVERNRRFQGERVEHLRHSELMDDYMEPRQLWTTRDVAIRVHSSFRPPGSEQQILRPWIVVNLVVALLVGVAWAVVSTRPDIDYTEEFLMTMEVEGYPRGDENLEIPA
uniref:Transmembrane protein 237a n=1 Tax=Neolamprologus brichardi TaxID=32507 RepID=A0A3Q4HPI2_NEOBR